MRGYVTPPTSLKVGVALLVITFLNTELNKPYILCNEIKQNVYSIGIFHALDPWGGVKRLLFFSFLKVVMLHIKLK